jgi:hypothetical protein
VDGLPLALEVPRLPVKPGQVDQGTRLQVWVAGGGGLAVPALAVLDGQRQQPDHPGRLGDGGEQVQVALGLGQAGLGRAQRLGGGARLEVAPGAGAGRLDQLVVAAGALGVPGDRRPVDAAGLLDGGQGLLVEPSPLPAEQAPGDRLAGQGVPEGEDVGLLLDHHVLGGQVAEDRDQLVLAAAGDGGQQVEGDAPAEDGGGVDHPPLPGERSSSRRSTASLRFQGRGMAASRAGSTWPGSPPAPRGKTDCRQCAGAGPRPPGTAPGCGRRRPAARPRRRGPGARGRWW